MGELHRGQMRGKRLLTGVEGERMLSGEGAMRGTIALLERYVSVTARKLEMQAPQAVLSWILVLGVTVATPCATADPCDSPPNRRCAPRDHSVWEGQPCGRRGKSTNGYLPCQKGEADRYFLVEYQQTYTGENCMGEKCPGLKPVTDVP